MTLLKGWIFTYSHEPAALGATLHMNEMYLKYAHFPTPNPANRKISNGQSISGLPRLNWRMQVNSQHDGFQPQSFGNFCETLTKICNTPKEGVRYGKEQDRPAKLDQPDKRRHFYEKGQEEFISTSKAMIGDRYLIYILKSSEFFSRDAVPGVCNLSGFSAKLNKIVQNMEKGVLIRERKQYPYP